jgi:MFS family permease
MARKQLIALFIGSLVDWTVGSGIIGLLPIYAKELGADPAQIGYFMASTFLAFGTGSTFGGWLSDRYQRRKGVLLISGTLVIPFIISLRFVTDFWLLVVVTFLVWFLAGTGFANVNILVGMYAEKAERGRIFGIISVTNSLGTLIGGLASGPIVDRWGFPALFLAAAAFWVLQPLAALFLEDRPLVSSGSEGQLQPAGIRALSLGYFIFLSANVVAWVSVHVGGLGRPLVMDDLGFDATAISSAVAISGAVTLPLPVLFGWLSDRLGRKPLLLLCYLASSVGSLVLVSSVSVGQFWLVAVLHASMYASLGVGRAYVVDLAPPGSLGIGMALFGITASIAGFFSLSVTGIAIEQYGMNPTMIAGAAFSLIAIPMLFFVRQSLSVPAEEVAVPV